MGSRRDQRAVIDFLADPATHGGVERVERFETHGNLVFLAGTEAFKIKRAVRFDYMDFSTLEKRRIACLREVEVNQRCGGDLYLGCVPIRRSLRAGIYPLAAMARSSSGPSRCGGSTKRICSARWLSTAKSTPISLSSWRRRLWVVMQMRIPLRPASGTAAFRTSPVHRSARSQQPSCSTRPTPAVLLPVLNRQLNRAASILDERARRGFVRRCHGDLHLANIVLWHGRPTLYDAIEFDEALATIDTLYDLAFLLMDLDFAGSDRQPISSSTTICGAAVRTGICMAWQACPYSSPCVPRSGQG